MATVQTAWSDDSKVIPREIFVDPEVYELELERVFRGPTWHLVAHESELPSAGDYKRSSIGNVPIFIVRGQDGNVRGLVNACAHRGTEVVNQKRGNTGKALRCIYHKWTYDLTGRLKGVALPEEFPESFRKEAHGLVPVRTESFRGCLFATLSPESPPLEEYLGETMTTRIADAIGDGDLVYLGSQSIVFRCNWKLYAENIFDSYHAPVLHGAVRILRTRAAPGSAFDVAFSADRAYAHAWTRYQALPIPEENRDVLNDYSLFDVRSRESAFNYVLVVFPGDVINTQLDVIQLRYVRPAGVDAIEIEFANFGMRGDSEELLEHRVHQANLLGPAGVVTLEDGCALERVQWSASAGGTNVVLKGALPGRPPYGYAEEGGIREFYASYRALMSDGS